MTTANPNPNTDNARKAAQTMIINYEAQFVTLDAESAAEMDKVWRRTRTYPTAEEAFRSAQRTEARGDEVAFAKVGDTYRVWVGEVTA